MIGRKVLEESVQMMFQRNDCCTKSVPTLNGLIRAARTDVLPSRNRWIALQRNQHLSHVCGWSVEWKTNPNHWYSGWNEFSLTNTNHISCGWNEEELTIGYHFDFGSNGKEE